MLSLLLLSRGDSHFSSVLYRNSPVGRAGEQCCSPESGQAAPAVWALSRGHESSAAGLSSAQHSSAAGRESCRATQGSLPGHTRALPPALLPCPRTAGTASRAPRAARCSGGKGRVEPHDQACPVPGMPGRVPRAPRPRVASACLQVAIGTSSAARSAPPARAARGYAVPSAAAVPAHKMPSPLPSSPLHPRAGPEG